MKTWSVLVALLAVIGTVLAADEVCTKVEDRVDCHPDEGASEANCVARGCTWCPAEQGQPWCFVKPDHGYVVTNIVRTAPHDGYAVKLTRSSNASYFGNDAENLYAEFEFQADERLRIKIRSHEPRYEVPLKINPAEGLPLSPMYDISFTLDPVFSFKIIRKSSGAVLIDTSLGGLTFSDQFIQFSTRLPSKNVYGVGENEQPTFRHSFDKFITYALYARDQFPSGTTNMYGVFPYYTVLEEDGNAHSVLIVNSNAQEFQFTPAPGIIYRTIGGILDIYVFLGPTPENTVQQYTQAVGRQPLPPYWGLGFQLSRWGYDKLENMENAILRTRNANIPQDVQYADIDVMDQQLDFTYNPVTFPDFPKYVKDLKEKHGVKFVPIVDPGIAFEGLNGQYKALDLGNELDIWVKRPDGTPVVGSVWPGHTYFPDFSKNATQDYWTTLFRDYKNVLDYDGIWIDMNEVASWGQGDVLQGCADNRFNNPPYIGAVKNSLYDGTICPDAIQEYGINYDTHSLYGWKESEVTFKAVREVLGKRSFILTRSTFVGVGQWAAHWLGDNISNWGNLKASIIGVLQYNQFGVPFVGADICGFLDTPSVNLCARWMQTGAFYPFSRNHNAIGTGDQDPGMWPVVAVAARNALQVRYTLLPSLYTLFYFHKTTGSTVARALWHEFPLDTVARGIDQQFLWGSGILISPVTDENVTSVKAYFPPTARWFDYYFGSEVAKLPGLQTLDAPLDTINVHVRGGGVYPTQQHAMNTELARKNPFGLIVALDNKDSALGHLYVDDGDSIEPQDSGLFFLSEYTVTSRLLTNRIVNNGYAAIEGQVLDNIRLFGAGQVTRVLVNGLSHSNFTQVGSETKINGLNLPLNRVFTISF